MLDTLIINAEVFDGEEEQSQSVAVGVKDGQIAFVGEPPIGQAAETTIDATGLWLSPGFIDSHASTGLGYLRDHAADNKLFQGVTTELIGNCGTSTAPVGPLLESTMNRLGEQIGFPFCWHDLQSYYEKVSDFGLPINLATLIGHSTLRHGVLENWHDIKPNEMEQMLQDLDLAMKQGSFGLSTGLIYAPGCYADIGELVELGKVVAAHGGFYASHIRDERSGLEEAVQEAMEIGRGANLPVLVSHLKAADKPNWGKIPRVLDQISEYREAHNMNVIVDVYPYTAVSTKLRAFLPKELLKDGIGAVPQKLANATWRAKAVDWLLQRQTQLEDMIIISDDLPDTTGKNVVEIAAMWGTTPEEAACRLVESNAETWIVYHCISDQDMDAAVLWPDAIICSDSWSYPVNAKTSIGNPHPRTYGAFSRFLSRYVFERPLLSYGAAIKKITSQPADFMGMMGRGRIREGYWADLLLMDPNQFADRATYQNPRQFSDGVQYLWINGKAAITEGAIINDKCGKVLRPN